MCIRDRSNSNFLNPMVIVNKNNQLRICLNMRNLNRITKKCFDGAPNAENVFTKYEGAKFWKIASNLGIV